MRKQAFRMLSLVIAVAILAACSFQIPFTNTVISTGDANGTAAPGALATYQPGGNDDPTPMPDLDDDGQAGPNQDYSGAFNSTGCNDNMPDGWECNPDLPNAKVNGEDYPGFDRTIGNQDSDGLARDVELTLQDETEVALIFGDSMENFAPLGDLGGQWDDKSTYSGCYLIVIKGPISWDTQPAGGKIDTQYPMFHWPLRSAWDAHMTNAELSHSELLRWTAQKVADLQDQYPNTCGQAIEVVVYDK